MSLDFYKPPPRQSSSFLPRNSQHVTNQRYFLNNKPQKKQAKIPFQKDIEQFRKTIHQQKVVPQIQEQEKFFPSIRSRVKDAYKMHQLFMINQKQKRRTSMMETKMRLYKEILETEVNIKKSKDKYLYDRSQRYEKIKNPSFMELNEKLRHQNRFNLRSNSSIETLGLEYRSNSLYFRTLDELDRTIHKVNKNQGYTTIQESASERSKNQIRGGSQLRGKYSYRYLEADQEVKIEESRGLVVGSIQNSYKKQRLEELQKQRQRINQMVKMYREYEENQALYKKIRAKS